MNVADMLKQTGALDSISQQLGIDSQSAQKGAAALLPALLGGFKKKAQTEPGGPDSLLAMLGGLGGPQLLDTVRSAEPTPREPGNQILGQIFGSKDVSRTVAGQAAQNTGIDSSVLKKMLPLLAMAVSGCLASQRDGGPATTDSGLGGMLGQALGGLQGGVQPQSSQHSGGLLGMLDMDRDGNPLDDILHMPGNYAVDHPRNPHGTGAGCIEWCHEWTACPAG